MKYIVYGFNYVTKYPIEVYKRNVTSLIDERLPIVRVEKCNSIDFNIDDECREYNNDI